MLYESSSVDSEKMSGNVRETNPTSFTFPLEFVIVTGPKGKDFDEHIS